MDYMEYLVGVKESLSVVDANDIFCEIEKDVASLGDVAKEMYDKFISSAISYAMVRSSWLLLTEEQKSALDKNRAIKHDLVITNIDILSRYLRENGKECDWRKELSDSRKRIGDFACYIAFIYGLKAR